MRGSHTYDTKVTPFVGVWIEILPQYRLSSKFVVTPFVGVWIEIARLLLLQKVQTVTPFVGVWIEMFPIFSSKFFKYSHSLRGSVD